MTSGTTVASRTHPQLGTFLGVFTPSVLTILGVVLFLRTGWVVGNIGLVPTILMVVLAHAITFSTALSVSAVATNMKVGAGGAYFMISRSLGLEIGGAIGVPLFLAQTFSVTLYAFGLAESLQLFWPGIPEKPVAFVTILLVSALAGRSTKMALRAQIPILAAIGLAIGSLVIGAGARAGDSLPLWSGVDEGVGFWVVFAVFFPAVTGLMAGVSLSGDLRDPTRSLPRGTLAAVAVGFVAYLSVPIALALAASPEQLTENTLIWFDVSIVPALVYPGLFGAILSSAVGSILGAPRTLEALVEDRVLPEFPSGGWLRKISPHIPHLISTAVALAAVGMGGLNAVAPVLTMFFLTTYAVVNLVAGLEALSGSPSYRPALKVPAAVSLAGAAGCLWVMWLIHPVAAVVAIVVEIMIYIRLRRRAMAAAWGDLRYGALMSLTRFALLKLRRLPVDPRNWRPNILVFAGDVEKRHDLVRYASWLNQDRGILTVSHILVGSLEELAPQREAELAVLDDFLETEGIAAFPEVEIAADFEHGVLQALQANGMAGLSSNTVMMGWSRFPTHRVVQLRIAAQAALLGTSTVICRVAQTSPAIKRRRIDVWWGGLQNNGDMLLLFAYLMSANRDWRDCSIAIKTIASSSMSFEKTEVNLRDLVARSRIQATTVVLPRPEDETVQQVIARESRDADLVLMGLREPRETDEVAYAERLADLIGDLPSVMLVRAAGPFSGMLLESSADSS